MMWFSLSRGTRRAPRIDDARNRPSSNPLICSPVACSTKVGTSSRGRHSDAPWWRRSWREAYAEVAEAETRISSSSQPFCSSVAAGMSIEVNTRRNVESGRAQPTLIIWSNVSSTSDSSGVWSRAASA